MRADDDRVPLPDDALDRVLFVAVQILDALCETDEHFGPDHEAVAYSEAARFVVCAMLGELAAPGHGGIAAANTGRALLLAKIDTLVEDDAP